MSNRHLKKDFYKHEAITRLMRCLQARMNTHETLTIKRSLDNFLLKVNKKNHETVLIRILRRCCALDKLEISKKKLEFFDNSCDT